MKKTVVISGINIVDGGAMSVFTDLLDAINNSKFIQEYKFVILVSRKKLFNKYSNNFEIIEFPKSKKHWLNRIYYEYFYFNKLSKQLKPYVWLSMHDMTPNVKADKRYVYCHNPSPFYKMKLREAKYGWKYYLFSKFYKYLYKINIRKNTAVIVQQSWMAREFKKLYKIPNIIVAKPSILISKIKDNLNKNEKIRFVYPSFPRPFKNFEVLCKAIKRLNNAGYIDDFEVLFTLDGTENRYSQMLLKKYGTVSNIKFLGLQSRKRLYEIYSKCKCLVFMSKLETWGMPISEFKTTKRSIIVADLPYAHETVGSYAHVEFVKPDSDIDLAKEMLAVILHEHKKNKYCPQKDQRDNNFVYADDWQKLLSICLN